MVDRRADIAGTAEEYVDIILDIAQDIEADLIGLASHVERYSPQLKQTARLAEIISHFGLHVRDSLTEIQKV